MAHYENDCIKKTWILFIYTQNCNLKCIYIHGNRSLFSSFHVVQPRNQQLLA